MDGWQDHQGVPVLAFMAVTPQHKAFLLKMQSVQERETTDFLKAQIQLTVQDLKSKGITVLAALGDNAANVQAALKASTDLGLLRLNCLAHTQRFADFYLPMKNALYVASLCPRGEPFFGGRGSTISRPISTSNEHSQFFSR